MHESLLITVKEKQLLTSTQNQMLRQIVGPQRRPEEPWLDWIKRATRAARAEAQRAGIRFWLSAHLKSKWCWAGHVTRMSRDRIARRALEWRDSEWWQGELHVPVRLQTRRPHRTRWFRWEDELTRYSASCGWSSWQDMAKRRDVAGKASDWLRHCNSFVKFSKK